ncbi:hypothetical protein ACKLNR_002647 [Fusarium oxysporum f. sp. zingiberi]
MASPQPQSNVVQTTPQPLMHQRSVARKPVGKPAGAPSQSISLPHRPAPQQQHPQAGYPPHNQQQQQQQQQNVQQQRPQSYHPGQQVQPVYHQQSPHQFHQAQPIAHQGQPIQHQQAQPAQYPPQQQQQQSQPHPQPPHLNQQPIQYQQTHQQAPQQLYQQQQQLPQQHVQAQHPQQQPFSPTNPSPNPAPQTTLPNTHQAQPQQSPASPTPQIHRVDTANSNIGSFVADHGRPGSISGSSAGIATPATTVATPSVAGTPRWEPNVVSAAAQQPPVSQQTPVVQHVPAQQSPAIHHAPGAQQPQPAQYAPTAQQIPAVPQNHPPQHTPAIQPTPAVQATPAADLRRTSTGQPQLCNHCRKGIPLNVSVYTCLICSTAHITTNFCVWCFTSNAVNTSHSHDKSYYATESDPRVQSSVQDATTQMWTIRKNVSGRLWYTHNSTGLKTHLKPTAAALFGFSGLPPGWDERKTPDGRTFYFNKRLGTSSWVKPANSLPDGWRELRTPDMTPFYINEQLGLSTWDRPGQQPRQTKQGNKVIVRKARPGQPNQPQNVGDSILSATVNAARLTGQGVEMASRQVGKLGKKKNWRKMGRMLNTVNSFGGIGSGSDGEYDDSYNDDGDLGFGGDDSSGFQDQQQGQFQQSFDYQQSSFSQPQQSFSFEDNQQSMFQQPAFEQQSTFEYSVQTEQPAFEQPAFDQQPAFGQQPEQFSVTTEVSYTINEGQPAFEQEVQYTQTYEQQPGFEVQQQTTFEAASTQEPILAQQTTSYETVITSEQVGVEPPIQLTEQPVYQVTSQETYPTQPYVYDPTQMPQQQVTISYSVPDYAAEPAPLFTTQTQAQQPMYPVFLQNNQPEIITSDIPLVEVPSTPENTTLILNSGYGSNDILAGTSLVTENNTAPVPQVSTPAPQDSIVVEVTVQSTPTPGLETSASPAPLVVQEYDASAKPASIVTVDPVQPVDYDVGARCNALI